MNYETIITITCVILAAIIIKPIVTPFVLTIIRTFVGVREDVLTHRQVLDLREHMNKFAIHAGSQSYGEAIRKRFDASTLTFAGFNTAAEMDVDTLGHFGMAVKSGHIEKMLDQQAELIRQIDDLKGGAK